MGTLAPQTALIAAQVSTAELQAAKENYIRRTLVGIDQFFNVIAGGLPDETISSRAQRDAIKGDFLAKVLTFGLDRIQADHGEKAQAGDDVRAATVVAVETTSITSQEKT